MTGLSHILYFSALIGAGFASVFFPHSSSTPVSSVSFEPFVLMESAVETPALPEKEDAFLKKELPYSCSEILLYNVNTKTVETLSLEDYVAGVLLAEMPSWYGEEALKAAAVAARTYTLYKLDSSSHTGGAQVCSDSSHCQAYYTLSDASLAWSEESGKSAEEKMRRAVSATEGEILTYDGKPILAVYHASSYLATRSSAEVFGGELPYLQSVESPHEDRNNTNVNTKSFTESEFSSILYNAGYISFPTQDYSVSDVWEGDRCLGLRVVTDIGETLISSARTRSLFSLKSATFTLNGYEFETYGYGHGVGMSQNGANILSQNGKSYEEILSHYYKGSELSILKKVNRDTNKR